MDKLDKILYELQNRTLDLSSKNNLINLKRTKSVIEITRPNTKDLLNMLFDGKKLKFPYINEFKEDDKIVVDYSDSKFLKTSFEDGLQLMRSLRNLRKKQKLIQQEKGLNSLYLAVGFLKWFDTSYSNIENYSPILLVPVKLINNKITEPFSIEIDNEEITVNPALIIRLKKDFGIEIKENYDGSYADLLKLFKSLCLNTNWKVEDKAYLGIFSFLKISIYNDYKKNLSSFKANPIISKIYGDDQIDDYFEYNFDDLKIKDNPLTIFDADSSQLEAIANATNGLSFVLQGPPGTGKSQTISNIIANSISNGKKVLFVSEKKAALDIVLKKMKDADLDEFCLNLHDVKSNRKSVLDDFQRVLNESKKSYILSSQVSLNEYNLEYSRDQLKEYCKLIHTPIKPLEISLFDAYSRISELESIPYLEFSIENIEKISEPEYINIINSISNFSVSKQRLSREIEDNPWNTYKHKNNYSIDLEYKFNEINKKINYYIEKYNNMVLDMNNKFGYKINNIKEFKILYDNIKILSSVDSIPAYWINNFNYDLFVNQVTSTQNAFNKYKASLNNYLNNKISFYPSILDCSIESVDEAIFELNNRINNEYLYSYWNDKKSINSLDSDFVNECIAKQKEIKSLENEINLSFTKAIFNTDYDLYLSRMLHDYSNIFNRLKKSYRNDINYFKSLCINDIPLKRKNIIELLKKLRLIGTHKDWFVTKEKILIDLLGNEYKSYNSNFESLETYYSHYCSINNGINELNKLKSELIDFNTSNKIFANIFDVDFLMIKDNCKYIISKINIINKFKYAIVEDLFSPILEGYFNDLEKNHFFYDLLDSFDDIYSSLNDIYKWFITNYDYSIEFNHADFNLIKTTINNCYEAFDLLREADAYDDALKKCIKHGLGDFISYSRYVTPSLLLDVFNKRFYMCWIEKMLTLNPYSKIRNFDSLKHDDIVNLFRKLDRESIKMNRSIVKFNIFNNMPPYIKNNTHYGEINILQKEISKSKNHKPLRVLFNSISSILQTLKPCMMMSPQTVSTYLDFDIFKFDLIIFDEASQVFVENSLPAIARGKQLIIAGDSKQLPPTNFFNVLSDDEYIETEENCNEIGESILEEFDKLPSLTLKWHYRSKNESLISFSNQSFYRNALYTFPSVIINKKDNGVEFIHCDKGRYDRGGKSGNKEEARKIAELVLEHLKTNPDRSLGIISFGSVQQEAIEFEINKLRYDYPEFEFFFDEEKPEYFFIKNLETVQGDERDTIIISVGYGKDLNGQFNMNFGPLNQLGGERRLNVAITRAKINCKVVSSFLPSELNADKCKNNGPKYLKQYLEFIMNNDSPNIYASNEFDSSFEENVFDFLIENNYEVDSQVGCSGYKIDIAVKDNNGNYCLGIECDGMTYHRTRTTRDRDRLRHDVLTGLGWKLHRIWSTDWIRNNKFEKQRLLDAIANSNVISKNYNNIDSSDGNFIITKEKDLLDDIKYYGFDINTNIEENLLNSLKYESKENIILKIIDSYYPIHEDLLKKLFCQIYFGYTNQKSYREFNAQLYILLSNKKILKHGQFYYPRYFTDIIPRIPNTRKMTQISYIEIAAVMKAVLDKCDMTFEEVSKEVARLYGFLIGYNQIVAKLMKDAYDFLMNNKKIKIIYDSIVVL